MGDPKLARPNNEVVLKVRTQNRVLGRPVSIVPSIRNEPDAKRRHAHIDDTNENERPPRIITMMISHRKKIFPNRTDKQNLLIRR